MIRTERRKKGMTQRALGQLLFGPDRVARLLMVERKDAVSRVLLALAAQWSATSESPPHDAGAVDR